MQDRHDLGFEVDNSETIEISRGKKSLLGEPFGIERSPLKGESEMSNNISDNGNNFASCRRGDTIWG